MYICCTLVWREDGDGVDRVASGSWFGDELVWFYEARTNGRLVLAAVALATGGKVEGQGVTGAIGPPLPSASDVASAGAAIAMSLSLLPLL